MAWLAATEAFDPDGLERPVIGIQSELGEHDSGQHCHRMGQILFSKEGCVRLTMNDGELLCLLPPTRVAWIPGGITHRAEMRSIVAYRSVWLDQTEYPLLPEQPAILSVNPLLKELLERIAASSWQTDWQQGVFAHMAALCVAELSVAHHEPMSLIMPRDRRLRALTGDTLPPLLSELAKACGASERTLSRIFQRETGMAYQPWRQQWRLMKAVEMLATGSRVTEAAFALGFASDSAFIHFFRSHTGETPGGYIGTRR
ncbi:AraC family transcriptional regulator [Enterobacteriaceae bacterium 89]|nr:AraC family transcriptional regulator [Enterobacteriaceae bacterium 89]